MDNIDIVENLARIYKADYWKKVTGKGQTNIDEISKKSKEIITKLYPVLYTEEFNLTVLTATDSACANPKNEKLRKDLIESALRFGVSSVYDAPTKAIE